MATDEASLELEPLSELVEEAELPAAVEGFSKRRVELVQAAAEEWRRALVDLGGRNNLLSYRDLRAGTLDLTDADPKAVLALLQSKAVKIAALFPDPEVRAGQLKRVRTIHNKARENEEERGVLTLSLGCGLATWDNAKRGTWTPAAPVLLRQASLRSLGAAQDEFELLLIDEMEVNPTLIHLLKVDFECELSPDELLDRVDGVIDEPWELEAAYDWMSERAARVPSFSIDPRLVLTNFAYAKLPMVNDIENTFDELVAHELIAAIAGDEESQEAIRNQGPGPDAVPGVDSTPVADEFLVLDADSSQNWAINQALAGGNLIVRGPPGTGKSQTIANLIASLTARGKTILFVAEKRAAIEAVLKRLDERHLGNLVLDLHAGVSSKRLFAQRVGEGLLSNRSVPKVEQTAKQRKLESQREQLNDYVRVLHDAREPWGLSVYEIRTELLGLRDYENHFRLEGDALAISEQRFREVETSLREYVRLGGLSLQGSDSPWKDAFVPSPEQAQKAFKAVDELSRHTLPTTLQALRRAAQETGLPEPASAAAWSETVALWQRIQETLVLYEPGIHSYEIPALCESFHAAEEGTFRRLRASTFSGDYKGARRSLRGLLREQRSLRDAELRQSARAACAELEEWRQRGGTANPQAPADVTTLATLAGELRQRLQDVEELSGLKGLADLPTEELIALTQNLIADRPTLVKLPELHRLTLELQNAGIEELVAEQRPRGLEEERAVAMLRFSFLQSILDQLALTDLAVEGFAPARHEATIKDFRTGDVEHIESTPERIKRLAAERVLEARSNHPDEERLLVSQATKKRGHLPVRDVVRNAESVLLPLKPCWAMSPLNVSQLLPAKTMFDVVIFDEASQITPADAIPSIVRGLQLIVAGDPKQLPPTAFFASSEEEEVEEQEQRGLVAGTGGYESILDALEPLIRWRMLLWHYRSRDERLIAFSNAHIYDRQLVTFPGVGGEPPLRYELAPWDPSADTNSPTPEVDLVVDLVIEHARTRPQESLGVIAMGIKHSTRIEECLRQRLRETEGLEEELSEFFAEDREERFFVKNLERVQGDERDAIILSIGYGKNQNGSVPLRFGPLLQEGGERRLNVAVTRAKNRVALVTSFKANELDLERTNAEGVRLLHQYLQYVESGGTNLGDEILDAPILNPFEVDVRDTLAKRGLRLVPQYGTSGYRIDFAVRHPTRPEFVLALECDGATYHSSESARDRDRLRQDQLERLGWRFCRIWSSEWFYDRDKAVEKVLGAYEKAVKTADAPPSATEPKRVERERPEELKVDRFEADAVAEQVKAAFGNSTSRWVMPRTKRDGRPNVKAGWPIDDYPQGELVALAKWILTDDSQLLTDDEVLTEMMRELGFQRRGAKIVATLEAAIKRAKSL